MTVLWRKGVVMQKSILAAFIALIGTTGAAAAASCSLPDVADKVDLKQVRGTNLVTVPVTINGTPRQLLLDIGTRPTKISQATVAELGLPEASRLTENIDTARVRSDLSFGSAPLQATVRQSGSGINPKHSACACASTHSPLATPRPRTCPSWSPRMAIWPRTHLMTAS
jgi:hypothetical protein